METIDFNILNGLQSRIQYLEKEIQLLNKTIAMLVYCAPEHKIEVPPKVWGLPLTLERYRYPCKLTDIYESKLGGNNGQKEEASRVC